jgi:hypothetical protein
LRVDIIFTITEKYALIVFNFKISALKLVHADAMDDPDSLIPFNQRNVRKTMTIN